MTYLLKLNSIVLTVIAVLSCIHVLYTFVGLTGNFFDRFRKKKADAPVKYNRLAVLIAARNESGVIGQLLDTVNGQTYPKEMLSAIVIADNCTDDTAEVARAHGAYVIERFNKSQIGKGYALSYAFQHIKETFGERYFDAYIVVDADNLLENNYVEEMNKTFNQGYRALTSYRNSKNYGTNWITAGYSLWFLREARLLNNSRMRLHTSCAISGTGWLVSSEVIAERGGWDYHTLTEDLEFTTDTILRGETIGYCGTAVLYDEQPETFAQSWRQRLRWSKGFLQIAAKYGKRMIQGIFTGKTPFACYDITLTIMPATILAVAAVLTDLFLLCYAVFGPMFMPHLTQVTSHAILNWLMYSYGAMFIMGVLTMLTEGKKIRATKLQKFVSLFTFPLFMMTYIPISVAAVFCKVEWKPIQHKVAKTLDEVR